MQKYTIGSSVSQQVWEAFTALCALRVWAPRWRFRRIHLRVKTDNVAALIMVVKLKASGFGVSLISREMALDIAEAHYTPQVAAHLPGQANLTADFLSRHYDHEALDLPGTLRGAQRIRLPARDPSWWRTL